MVAVSDVRAIIETDASDATITALIAQAVILTGPCSVNWTAEQTEAINTWITAHLIASSITPTTKSEKLGDATDTYDSAVLGQGLFGTPYGQTALTLDDSGCLAKRGMKGTLFKVL